AVVPTGGGGGLISPMQERWERILSAAERETNTQIAAYQQGRTDAMQAPQPARQAQAAQQPTYTSGQGTQGAGYPQGTQGPGAERPGTGYPQGSQGPEDPQGHDPGARPAPGSGN